jgi:hypothetical protein
MLSDKETLGSIWQGHDVPKRRWHLFRRSTSDDADYLHLNLAHGHAQEGARQQGKRYGNEHREAYPSKDA